MYFVALIFFFPKVSHKMLILDQQGDGLDVKFKRTNSQNLATYMIAYMLNGSFLKKVRRMCVVWTLFSLHPLLLVYETCN